LARLSTLGIRPRHRRWGQGFDGSYLSATGGSILSPKPDFGTNEPSERTELAPGASSEALFKMVEICLGDEMGSIFPFNYLSSS
jgi:hypothetical protein